MVLLVNHAFARGTPAIFVIFVVSRDLSSKALVLLVRMQIRHFRLAGQKHGLPKHRFLDPEKLRNSTRIMRCAKRIFAKGILGCTGSSPWRWEKGSETPSCDGEQGLRLPRSPCRSMRNEGVSDPLSHRKKESQTLFHRKRENPVHPKISLAKIP